MNNEISGSAKLSYCDIEGGVPGFTDNGNNIAVDPKFVNAGAPDTGDGWLTGLACTIRVGAFLPGTGVGAPAVDILNVARNTPPCMAIPEHDGAYYRIQPCVR